MKTECYVEGEANTKGERRDRCKDHATEAFPSHEEGPSSHHAQTSAKDHAFHDSQERVQDYSALLEVM